MLFGLLVTGYVLISIFLILLIMIQRSKAGTTTVGGDALVYEPVQELIAYGFRFDSTDHFNTDCVRQ